MNKNFEEQLKSFKPEFGNMKHVQILGMVERLRQKEKLLKNQITLKRTIAKKLKEIEMDERKIIYNLTH
ncbi:MAG: hypothetical protein V4509_00535 [Patescibacteria group bacterium]